MGSVHAYETRAGKRFEARYRRPDSRPARKGGFKLKRDAQAYLDTVEVSKLQGAYIAPSDSRATVAVLGAAWLTAHQSTVKPSTFYSDESAWRVHVAPQWGSRAVGSIRHTEVQAWVALLARDRSRTLVARAHGMLAAILEGAVKDKRISTNPARDVKLPRKKKGTRAYLSHQQVERLARAAKYPDLIRFLSYTGLRWGEATGLRVKHIDQVSRRIRIEENAVSVNGQIVIGTPKTHERRAVVFPPFLDQAISRACKGKSSEDLVWGDGLKHLRSGDLRRGWFVAAVARVRAEDEILAAEARASGTAEPNMMPKLTPHDLRHTAASLAISAGANVKAVQRMLGHASAAMTLDTYSDLYEDDLESVAVALDSARRQRLEQ